MINNPNMGSNINTKTNSQNANVSGKIVSNAGQTKITKMLSDNMNRTTQSFGKKIEELELKNIITKNKNKSMDAIDKFINKKPSKIPNHKTDNGGPLDFLRNKLSKKTLELKSVNGDGNDRVFELAKKTKVLGTIDSLTGNYDIKVNIRKETVTGKTKAEIVEQYKNDPTYAGCDSYTSKDGTIFKVKFSDSYTLTNKSDNSQITLKDEQDGSATVLYQKLNNPEYIEIKNAENLTADDIKNTIETHYFEQKPNIKKATATDENGAKILNIELNKNTNKDCKVKYDIVNYGKDGSLQSRQTVNAEDISDGKIKLTSDFKTGDKVQVIASMSAESNGIKYNTMTKTIDLTIK